MERTRSLSAVAIVRFANPPSHGVSTYKRSNTRRRKPSVKRCGTMAIAVFDDYADCAPCSARISVSLVSRTNRVPMINVIKATMMGYQSPA
jgi:hypothetical protein